MAVKLNTNLGNWPTLIETIGPRRPVLFSVIEVLQAGHPRTF